MNSFWLCSPGADTEIDDGVHCVYKGSTSVIGGEGSRIGQRMKSTCDKTLMKPWSSQQGILE